MSTSNRVADVTAAFFEMNAVALPEQPIRFKAGMLAPVYVDNRCFPFFPEQWKKVIQWFQKIIETEGLNAEVIAGIEAAGIPHSAALAFTLQTPSVFVRKQAKDHGTKKLVEGGKVSGKKVLLIEDLVTTGSSSLAGVEALRAEGAEVTHCLSIVSYDFPETRENFKKANMQLHPLVTFRELAEEAAHRGIWTKEQAQKVADWVQDPWMWTKNHEPQ